MKIENLEWDSTFFGYKIQKVDLENGQFNLHLVDKQTDLLYVFSKEKSSYLEKQGAKLVDIKVTFTKKIEAPQSIEENQVVVYSGAMSNQLRSLAIQSGEYSRFKVDERLQPKFEELYTLWIQRSIDRTFADEVLVGNWDNEIMGMVTISKKADVGQIGIIAVDKGFRGKGLGRQLLHACELWCFQNDIKAITVATQKQNLGACRFYENNGFDILRTEFIYHLWKV